MVDRSFHIRRPHRYKLLIEAVGVAMLLAGFPVSGNTAGTLLMAMGAGVLVAACIMHYRPYTEYVLGTHGLLLRRGALREELPLEQLPDANVVDMDTARSCVRQHNLPSGEGPRPASTMPLTQYCSIPLNGFPLPGPARSEAGPWHARRSLVLLRIRDGRSLLLSPRHSESMASAINKALRTEVAA